MDKKYFEIVDNIEGGETWWLDGWAPTGTAVEGVRSRVAELDAEYEDPSFVTVRAAQQILRYTTQFQDGILTKGESSWMADCLREETPAARNCVSGTSAANRLSVAAGVDYIVGVRKGHAYGYVRRGGEIAFADSTEPTGNARIMHKDRMPNMSRFSETMAALDEDGVGVVLLQLLPSHFEIVTGRTASEASRLAVESAVGIPLEQQCFTYFSRGEPAVKLLAAIAIRQRPVGRLMDTPVDFVKDILPHKPYFGKTMR